MSSVDDQNPLTQSAKMRVSYFNPVAGLGGAAEDYELSAHNVSNELENVGGIERSVSKTLDESGLEMSFDVA